MHIKRSLTLLIHCGALACTADIAVTGDDASTQVTTDPGAAMTTGGWTSVTSATNTGVGGTSSETGASITYGAPHASSTDTTDTTTDAPHVCSPPSGTGEALDAIGFPNPNYHEFVSLALGPDRILTALVNLELIPTCTDQINEDPVWMNYGGSSLPYFQEDAKNFAILRYDSAQPYAESAIAGHMFGGPGQQSGAAVTLDAAGNLYVVGSFTGDLKVPKLLGVKGDETTLYGANEKHHAFILAFAPNGAHLWSTQLGDDLFEARFFDVRVAASGEVTVVGTVQGPHGLGAGCAANTPSKRAPLVARYAPVDVEPKTPIWVKCPEVTGAISEAHALDLDLDGGIVVTGQFEGALTWRDAAGEPIPASATSAIGTQDLFVARWDASGEFSWQERCGSQWSGGAEDEIGEDVLVGSDGRIYIAGAIGEGSSCLDDAGTGAARSTGFVAALDPSPQGAAWVWQQTVALGEGGGARIARLAHDSEENILALGEATPTIAFGGLIAEAVDKDQNYQDMTIAKLTCDGEVAWLRRFGANGAEEFRGLAVAEDNTVHLGGYYFDFPLTVDDFVLPDPISNFDCQGFDTAAALIHLKP